MSDSDTDFEEAIEFDDQNDEDNFDPENIEEMFDVAIDDDDESDFEEKSESSKKRKSPPKSTSKAPAAKRTKKEPSSTPKTKKAATESAPSTTKSKPASSKGVSKVKELTEKEAYPVILKYINDQNKPFSSTIVFENMHKEVKKAHAVRILAQLAQENKIIEKEYGKTKIYYADQSQFPSVSEEELISMEEQVNALKEEEKQLTSKLNILKGEFKNLQNALPDDELQKAIDTFTQENAQMTTKLETLKNSGAIDKTQLDLLQQNVNKYTKLWKQRRSLCKEGIKTLADGLELKDQEVIEAVGIETEEELGITLPFKK